MNRRFAITCLCLMAMLAFGAGQAVAAGPREVQPSGNVHYHAARGAARSSRPRSSPDMTFHGGQVITTAQVKAIFWGTSWSSSSFVGDKISGLDSLYANVGGSAYAGTTTEYSGSNGPVSGQVSYGGNIVDTTAAPSKAPATSTILNEVAKQITNPVTNGYYPVYTDTRRGSAGYCAWHSYGTVHGVVVQFAFFFNLDGDPGCDPQDSSGAHSQGLAALANVTGHELSEALTDPRLNAWFDSSGAENGDKCAWTFNKPVNLGGTSWKIQGNWSNRAYDNGKTGYIYGGCIDGN